MTPSLSDLQTKVTIEEEENIKIRKELESEKKLRIESERKITNLNFEMEDVSHFFKDIRQTMDTVCDNGEKMFEKLKKSISIGEKGRVQKWNFPLLAYGGSQLG